MAVTEAKANPPETRMDQVLEITILIQNRGTLQQCQEYSPLMTQSKQ